MKLSTYNLFRKENPSTKNRNALLSMSLSVVAVSLTLTIAACGGGGGGESSSSGGSPPLGEALLRVEALLPVTVGLLTL